MQDASNQLAQVIRDFRRDQIIEAARRLFVERGTIDVPMGDIASAAGVSRPTVYNHFTTRDRVVAACLVAGQTELVADMEHRLATVESPVQRLATFIEVAIDHVDERPDFFRMVTALQTDERADSATAALALDITGLELGATLRQILISGTEVGAFDLGDVEAAQRLVGNLLLGVLHQRMPRGSVPARDVACETVGLLVRGFGPRS